MGNDYTITGFVTHVLQGLPSIHICKKSFRTEVHQLITCITYLCYFFAFSSFGVSDTHKHTLTSLIKLSLIKLIGAAKELTETMLDCLT